MNDEYLTSFAESGLRFPVVAHREGYVTSGDARLWFASFGTGRPVLLLHGGLGNGTNWALQVGPLLERGYGPVVMDTRGHGRSTAGSQRFSYRLLASDVMALADHLGWERFSLVGWSDGACTALEVARTRPERTRGVVFFACNVDPTGTLEFSMTPIIQNCVTRHQRDFETMTPTFNRFEDLPPQLAPMQQHEPHYSTAELERINVPVAVVQGDRDEFIKLEHAEYLARTLPQARLERLDGLGHFAPLQNPSRFNKVLLRSLVWFDRDQVGRRD